MVERSFDCDVAIMGAGPAGLAAAVAAAGHGLRAVVIDESPWVGGQIWRGAEEKREPLKALRWIERARLSGAQFLAETSVVSAPGDHELRAEGPTGPLNIRWGKLILATGARELFLPFPGWTLPGVFGAGGLQSLAKAGWPIARKRAVIAGSGPLLLAVADGLRAMGARVILIAEQAPWARVRGFGATLLRFPAKLAQAVALRARLTGIPYRFGTWPISAEGEARVEQVTLTDGARTWSVECDQLACGFGLVPNVELALLLGCGLRGGFVAVDEWQQTSREDILCAGEPTGIGGYESALIEGEIAGHAAAGARDAARVLFDARAKAHRFRDALRSAFALGDGVTKLARADTIVCRCEDVPHGVLKEHSSWRDAKLQSRCGMGACQGRVCGAACQVLYGWGMESIRPPIGPARIGSLMATTHPSEMQS